MNVLVCFTVIPDWDGVLDEDWTAFSPNAELSYVRRIFNPDDEAALETALQIKDANPSTVCAAVTVGVPPPVVFVRQLFAAGFDRVTVVNDPACLFDPVRTATRLTEVAAGFDLILTGRQSGTAGTGLVPHLLAQQLGDIIRICGEEMVLLRAATLRQQLDARNKTADILNFSSDGNRPPLSFSRPDNTRRVQMITTDPVGFLLQPPRAPVRAAKPPDGALPICGGNLLWLAPHLPPLPPAPAEAPCPLLFVGGQGLRSMENAQRLRKVANKAGAAVGFTRPAILNGWGRFDELVGQSGRQYAPETCVVLGASGAAAFAIGLRRAGTVIAVNTDPDAPIFKQADYGILSDAGELLEAMCDGI